MICGANENIHEIVECLPGGKKMRPKKHTPHPPSGTPCESKHPIRTDSYRPPPQSRRLDRTHRSCEHLPTIPSPSHLLLFYAAAVRFSLAIPQPTPSRPCACASCNSRPSCLTTSPSPCFLIGYRPRSALSLSPHCSHKKQKRVFAGLLRAPPKASKSWRGTGIRNPSCESRAKARKDRDQAAKREHRELGKTAEVSPWVLVWMYPVLHTHWM